MCGLLRCGSGRFEALVGMAERQRRAWSFRRVALVIAVDEAPALGQCLITDRAAHPPGRSEQWAKTRLSRNFDEQHPGIGDAGDEADGESRHKPVETAGRVKNQADPCDEQRRARTLCLHNPDYQPQAGMANPRAGVTRNSNDLYGPGE